MGVTQADPHPYPKGTRTRYPDGYAIPVPLPRSVSCNILFQRCFSPSSESSPFKDLEQVYLFVQDLQDVDDVFELAWFWAKDPGGLECLNQADMLALGLDEAHPSKICFSLSYLTPSIMKDLHVFHEIFGFAADSPDVPLFLDLPVASVEWDGMYLSLYLRIQLILLQTQGMRMAL